MVLNIKKTLLHGKKVINSVSELLKHTAIVSNLSRQKMLILTVSAMLQSRSVCLSELSHHLNPQAKTESNETRLGDFFRESSFDYDALATVLVSFLLKQPNTKIRLTVDRTNWEYGSHSINILMIIASKGAVHVPLYWEMLDNEGGNSNSEQRIAIFDKCIKLLDAKNIGLVLGDREFIGQTWLKYLKDKKLPFCVRVPKNHLVENTVGEKYQVETIWKSHKNTTQKTIFKDCIVDKVWSSAMITTDAKGKLLFLFSSANVQYLDQFYAKRWTIETLFQAFKTRGFNLESTHITINERPVF